MTAWDFFNMHTALYVVSLAIALAAIVGACEAIGKGLLERASGAEPWLIGSGHVADLLREGM